MHPALIEAHNILVRIAQVPDVEVFKITLEYWNLIATDLHHESAFVTNPPLLLSGMMSVAQSPRRQLYAPVLSKVRAVMVSRMAKPEEVCSQLTMDNHHFILNELLLIQTNLLQPTRLSTDTAQNLTLQTPRG